jgi:AmmeMemoRadiSam system protein B
VFFGFYFSDFIFLIFCFFRIWFFYSEFLFRAFKFLFQVFISGFYFRFLFFIFIRETIINFIIVNFIYPYYQILFEVMFVRKAAYAGLFYPKTSAALNNTIQACFSGDLGPGALPSKPRGKVMPVKAVISPHAGYVYSGMAAAWAYKALAETEIPDLFILLGPNHRSNQSGFSLETFETPFGLVRPDQEFAKSLIKKGNIQLNEEIHAHEHSIEVQLPFLQFSLGNSAEKIKILPLLVSDDLDLDKAAKDLRNALAELKKRAIFIVSSDFTHFGPNYGFLPFSENVKENISKLDKGAIAFIQKADAEGFKGYIHKTQASVCGYLPIILLLKSITFEKASLEQYYTSGDITGDYTNTVSYASIIFR